MSKARKCDRCGKLYPLGESECGYHIEIYIEDDKGLMQHAEYDLCSQCADRLDGWLDCKPVLESH